MDYSILAHAGGIDEMAIILFPLVVGGGVWLLTAKGGPEGQGQDAEGSPHRAKGGAPAVRSPRPEVEAPASRLSTVGLQHLGFGGVQAGFDAHLGGGGLKGTVELGGDDAPGQDDLEQHGVDRLGVLADHPGVHVDDVDRLSANNVEFRCTIPGGRSVDGDDVRVSLDLDGGTSTASRTSTDSSAQPSALASSAWRASGARSSGPPPPSPWRSAATAPSSSSPSDCSPCRTTRRSRRPRCRDGRRRPSTPRIPAGHGDSLTPSSDKQSDGEAVKSLI